jgi:putative thioredoxin
MSANAIDVTDDSFETDVLVRSDDRPVVIDLWAPWCGPCRTLGPIIEQVVGETDGAALLAKVNIDENPRVQATFKVQSIPAVFAIYQRQVIDGFIGALPERDVQAFVDRVLERAKPTEAELLVRAGDEASLRKALEIEPANEKAISALAALLIETGTEAATAEALGLLERIPETAETRRLAALARTGVDAAAADGESDVTSHLDALLDRVPGDDDARQQIVDLLETMDPDDPRRQQYRRALAARLF